MGIEKNSGQASVFVRVDGISASGRLIAGASDPVQLLEARADDIRRGIGAGAEAMRQGITDISAPSGWDVAAVEGKFGISLGAEGSIIITKLTAEATFEVTVRFEPTR